jgi:hypothetical protein
MKRILKKIALEFFVRGVFMLPTDDLKSLSLSHHEKQYNFVIFFKNGPSILCQDLYYL